MIAAARCEACLKINEFDDLELNSTWRMTRTSTELSAVHDTARGRAAWR